MKLRHILPFVAVMTLMACDDDDPADPGPTFEFEATLVGSGTHDDVEGVALVVAEPARFVAEVSIEGAAANEEFSWTVARGTCASPRTAIGAADRYGELDVAANGTAEAEALVNVALAEDSAYIVRITDVTGSDTVTVACGALASE